MQKEIFMQKAIDIAKEAINTGKGMAFGAVIVKDEKIISIAHNTVHKTNDPTNHAEVNAIRESCKILNTSDLSGCTLYSTCEPCPMCFTAIWWANITKLVYGVSLEDITNVSEEMLVDCEYLNSKGNSKIDIEGGFMKEKCLELYKS